MLVADVPVVTTFHRAGGSEGLHLPRPARPARSARRAAIRCAVSEDARRTAQSAIGGTYEVVFNGIEADRFAKASPTPADLPDGLLPRPPRASEGPVGPARGVLDARARRAPLGRRTGPQTDELREQVRRRPPHRVARPAVRRRGGEPAGRAPPSSAPRASAASRSASCFSRRWRPVPRSSPATCPATGPSSAAGGDGLLVPPGRSGCARRGPQAGLDRPDARPPPDRRQRRASGRQYSMDALARRYLELYDRVLRRTDARTR